MEIRCRCVHFFKALNFPLWCWAKFLLMISLRMLDLFQFFLLGFCFTSILSTESEGDVSCPARRATLSILWTWSRPGAQGGTRPFAALNVFDVCLECSPGMF